MMISNHNRATSSFRIIEPKHHQMTSYQHAQQMPINLPHQIPILTINNNNQKTNHLVNSNSATNLMYHQQQQQQQHFQQQQQQRIRNLSDTDSSYIPETTSESGISDLDMSEKCTCCPYGYHIDVDFVTFLQTLGGKNLNKQLKKIQRKRNERLQRSMEYVIDEVEKLRQMNGESGDIEYIDSGDLDQPTSPYPNILNNNSYRHNQYNNSTNPSPNNISSIPITCTTTTTNTTTSSTPTRQILIPHSLKKTINKIDRQIIEDQEIFEKSNGAGGLNLSIDNEAARKLLILERGKALALAAAAAQRHKSSSLNNSLNNHQQTFSSSVPPPNERAYNYYNNRPSTAQHNYSVNYATATQNNMYTQQLPRRSYSSCAEPFRQINNNNYQNNSQYRQIIDARRCSSNRASPSCTTSSIHRLNEQNHNNHYYDLNRRSRSANKRPKSKSPIQQQYFRREIKINLSGQSSPVEEHHNHSLNINDDQQLEQTEMRQTVTTHHHQQKLINKPISQSPALLRHHQPPSCTTTPLPPAAGGGGEAQEEVLLNLFSCNNSGSISSESSESLVEFDNDNENNANKLKINEVYEVKKQECLNNSKQQQRTVINQHQLILEKKLLEMEKKLQRLPELEIRNNILLEEKQLLLKQLKQQMLNPPQFTSSTTTNNNETTTTTPAKLYRSIGCNSNETEFKRDATTECRVNTREVGISNKLDDPLPVHKEEIVKMQTIITKLREKLSEQTLIMQQQLVKPTTRDVAVMHVVDRVEEPVVKPELRDVAINHRTEINDDEHYQELIEKHTIITNTYIKEIEVLRIENAKLSANLEELIRKHSKHVVTRGTHALEQPVLYSVGTNTKKQTTRDVQVMFTPKSRDVSLSTDRFFHSRDVGLMCTLGLAEQQEQMSELLEIKKKYELEVAERVKQIKSYRDVAIVCNLDYKEQRNVSLGCNLEPVKQMRDVSLKCNLDEEFKNQLRDVCIGCNLDVKEQKDACIYVNTIEPAPPPPKPVVKEKRDFSSFVLMEDLEKTQMAQELANYKSTKPVVTKDAGCSADHRSRLMDDLLRNQSSSMETIKCTHKQMNTETLHTRDISCEALNLNAYEIENEKNKLIKINSELKEKLKCLQDELNGEKKTISNLNEKLTLAYSEQIKTKKDSNNSLCVNLESNDDVNNRTRISVRNHINRAESMTTKCETEFEQHRITKTGSNNKVTQQETVSLKASLTDNSGEKLTEQTCYSTSSAKNYAQPLICNEITIPIYKENELINSSSVSPKTAMTNIIDQFVGEQQQQTIFTTTITENVLNESLRTSEKKPKGILKSTSSSTASDDISLKQLNDCAQFNGEHTTQVHKKALTFGENEIVEGSLQSEQSGSEFSLDESGQNNTIIQNELYDEEVEEDEELNESRTDVYETPITTIENIIVETSLIEEDDQQENKLKRMMKTEQSNANSSSVTDELDDYELQEKLMMNTSLETTTTTTTTNTPAAPLTTASSSTSSSGVRTTRINDSTKLKSPNKHRELEKQQEDDTNISNVQATTTTTLLNGPKQTTTITKSNINPQKNVSSVSERFELELELHIACAILNDSLYEPLKADKNKVARALNLIQQDWFKLAAKKDSNPSLVEEHLNAFYSRFSNLLLERIVNMADLILNTALHYSVSNGNFEIVNLLLDTKVCDVNAQNKAGGYTSIMLAALVPITSEYERMTLKRLFAEGNVNIKSADNGQTALMLAVMHGNKETVSLLLEAGSDCNLQDKEGSTALMAACEHGHIEIVRLLLDNTNCDPDIKDNDGETAFDISKKKKRNDIIVLLYAHSSKLRSHHPAIQFSKSRPRIGSSGTSKK